MLLIDVSCLMSSDLQQLIDLITDGSAPHI